MTAAVPATATPPPLSPEMAEQLAQLRDIHLPGAVSWWPLAPGWWILLAMVLAVTIGLGLMEIRRRRTLKYRALRELATLLESTAGQPGVQPLATELCVLIRRIVLAQAGGSHYANVHGDAWGERLAAEPNGMPADIARFIAMAPYIGVDAANEPTIAGAPARQALIKAAEYWIRRHA